jgi:transcriptional regulator with XRE-family HTH domain
MTKPGRPTTYNEKIHPNLVKWLSRDGFTYEQIAERLGIAVSTFKDWVRKYPDLSTAIKNSKELCRYEVEDSLYKRAKGYEYEKTEIEVQQVGGKDVKKKKVTTMHVPGDVTAQIFYLKTQWKDKYGEVSLDFDKQKGEINDLFNRMKEADVAQST